MPISLHDALIPSWLQGLQAIRGLLDTAEKWCADNGVAESDLIGARLIDDMHPFAFQILATIKHSAGGIKNARAGAYGPKPAAGLPTSFAELKPLVDTAIEELGQVNAEELEELFGRDVHFQIPAANIDMHFTAENYLLSFAQPNFYFHAATAYDILRSKGLPIGKRDFLGPVRIKAPETL